MQTSYQNNQFPSLNKQDKSIKSYDKVYLKSQIKEAYEKVVYWPRNIFELPKGQYGKAFIREITEWVNRWSNNTEYRDIAFDPIFVMPNLLLQRTNIKAKGSENKGTLNRRLSMWREGKVIELLNEGQALQNRFELCVEHKKSDEDIAKRFKTLMAKGEVKNAIRLIETDAAIGILPLNDETKHMLHDKHPVAEPLNEQMLLNEPLHEQMLLNEPLHEQMLLNEPLHEQMLLNEPLIPGKVFDPIIFEEITPDLIQKIAIKTKGAAGPSFFTADDWRRMLGSKLFGKEGMDLCRAISNLAKKLCTKKVEDLSSITSLMACRLIPLDKNPCLRPIGIDEVLRRIIGKAVNNVLGNDLKSVAGGLQLCVGQEGGAEAGIHGMREIFEDDDTEGLIQVDANNAFNTLNRAVLLHNIKYLCQKWKHMCIIVTQSRQDCL